MHITNPVASLILENGFRFLRFKIELIMKFAPLEIRYCTHRSLYFAVILPVWILLTSCRLAHAHEISPSVSDLEINADTVTLELKLNLEAFVAGIDLQSLDNTDNTEEANDYDVYRAMEPEQLVGAFHLYWPEMAENLKLSAPEPLALELTDVIVPPLGDVELPRKSTIRLSAELPAGASSVTVAWPGDYGTLIVRQQGVDSPYTGYIEGGGVTDPVYRSGTVERTAWQNFVYYIPVGFTHIIPKGLDHILFVLGLFFLATQFKPLILQISVFTLAHTITLLLGALGWVEVPASVVEPLIAASIVFVAVENLFTDSLRRWRTLLIFFFGLLHGLGFASVLGEFGLPTTQFIPALLGFNVGVEVGQLTVIAVAFFAISLWLRNHPNYRQWVVVPASLLIALTGGWWFFERVFLG